MPTIDDAQAAAWRLAKPDVVWNPNSAIAKKWLELKSQGIFLGVPIGDELPLAGGQAAQAFTSGAVLVWVGGNEVEIR